jgi:protein-tyrosine-phosphatase
MTKHILIVCLGNTCRSPMATALLNEIIRRHGQAGSIEVSSAGIWAQEGHPATPLAQRVMQERGLDISAHRSHLLKPQDVAAADVVVAMEKGIAEAIAIESPDQAGRVHTLADLADEAGDVQDPIGGSLDDYRRTADLLQAMLNRAYGRILVLLGLASSA